MRKIKVQPFGSNEYRIYLFHCVANIYSNEYKCQISVYLLEDINDGEMKYMPINSANFFTFEK